MSSNGKKPQNKTARASLISRRKIEPVLLQAQKAASAYEETTGCSVIVLDSSGLPADGAVKETNFCTLCKRAKRDVLETTGTYYYLCVSVHLEAIKEAKPEGSSYVYVCERGIAFWISPFYSGGRYIGAFLAGKVWIADTGENDCCEEIPKKTHSEINALSRLLLACAAAVSESPEDLAQELTVSDLKPETDFQTDDSQKRVFEEQAPKKEETISYPLDRERFLLASLRRGDTETGRRILKELLDRIQKTSPDNFSFIKFRAMELVVLLSRAAAIGGENGRVIFETNNRYFRRIQESKNMEELLENAHDIVDHFSEHIFSFQGIRHASALRRAERFIWINYTRKISLQEIADVSGLSPAYFSTVFKEEMGENISAYINRLRVEKAAMMLAETRLSLNAIARACGFENQCWFSKLFKTYTGINPGKYREKGGNLNELHIKFNEQKNVVSKHKSFSA